MNIQPQTQPDLAHVADLIKDIPIAMMVTRTSDASLVSRPMAALEMDADGAISFFTHTTSDQLEHLDAINLSFSDAHSSTFVSLSGRGEIDTERSHIERLWTPMARPWFAHGPATPDLVLLRFVPQTAHYWDGPNSRMVRAFNMAASVAAGRPIGMADHGEHTRLSSAGGTR
jgi:general stress protein 26